MRWRRSLPPHFGTICFNVFTPLGRRSFSLTQQRKISSCAPSKAGDAWFDDVLNSYTIFQWPRVFGPFPFATITISLHGVFMKLLLHQGKQNDVHSLERKKLMFKKVNEATLQQQCNTTVCVQRQDWSQAQTSAQDIPIHLPSGASLYLCFLLI